jgi:hypothetical protein
MEVPVKRLNLKSCVVTIPDRDTAPAVVLYGGLYGWEGDWFLTGHNIPFVLLQSVYFILPGHYTIKYKDCITEFRASVGPEGISRIRGYSLCGFSRGAQEVYRYRDAEQWKILGLIDPSAPTLGSFKDDVLDGYSDKIRCVYWVPNWGAGGYGGRVPRFAQHLRDLEVKMVEKAVAHPDMPTFFFLQFKNDFMFAFG